MIRLFLFIAALWVLPSASYAQSGSLSIDLAHDQVDITAGFTGAEMTLFGVKEGKGHVAVVIRGPKKTMSVARKENVMGLWFNRHRLKFGNVPAYYDYALSAPESDLAKPETLKEHGIGLNALRFAPDTKRSKPKYFESFQEALIRNKQAQGLFPLKPRGIVFIDDNFFRATFYLPSNVPAGRYEVEGFLIKNGRIALNRSEEFNVGQVGMEARIYKFAHGQSLAYGLLCVVLAVLAGWVANAAYRRE